ncbi:hypothetical protein OG618_00115 [Kitasatospora sp. NBC_01246]|uniref:hypothetical protein n=1 Tax=Kitasatospora sp. NBC_01246 TaxID=2903570 RepID=UPI002E35D0A3|nr:hypothetical protein [Kitasatospora sp. NBC_01246]
MAGFDSLDWATGDMEVSTAAADAEERAVADLTERLLSFVADNTDAQLRLLNLERRLRVAGSSVGSMTGNGNIGNVAGNATITINTRP